MYSYFMEICEYIAIRHSRSFLKVTFDSFSSSAPSILMPGRHRREAGGPLACIFSHNPPWLLIHMHAGKPHWSPSPDPPPPQIESASYSEAKYSVGTSGVLLQPKHISISTLPSYIYSTIPFARQVTSNTHTNKKLLTIPLRLLPR